VRKIFMIWVMSSEPPCTTASTNSPTSELLAAVAGCIRRQRERVRRDEWFAHCATILPCQLAICCVARP